ncbi:DEAD/DEAH box helicase [Bacillus thuringiensis]|uniref:type I restriction endonuclease subunit R n=1 Tax=Bacillus thuringiensis TaxID=1428 RepID=UPI000A3B41D1|nr:type I restriction endonuclease subunit R [Bacillus thuringiensis]MCU4722015.1 type I restriction endonuclease subunit R [Bacillus cereus]MBG9749809.1 DEAD/DEAH box helicase [Bacillus thuringiensis]MBG9776507.1 DEAD/DEAH box helicase [Bacillus thuringiensis]MBG9924249.1 DEAD/DEAH box helicase [Bacillus thuringiensis]OTZ89111.1 DEAD/DEAH box helicase [Bacillus thuringiensis serovar ostriniae]
MFKYNEWELESAALEWLEEMDYEIVEGPDIAPDGNYAERESFHDVVLVDRLRDSLQKINPTLERKVIEEAIQKIIANASPNIVLNNKQFHKFVTDGIEIQTQGTDGYNPTVSVYVFDFENPKNNNFMAVNQFTVIEGQANKRPDIIVFVNGLPLVVIELKNATNEDVDITDAYNQLQTYKQAIPTLFRYNAFLIASDGINARVGSLTANEERFMKWRTVDGETLASPAEPQLEVMIKGVLEPSRLLNVVQNFILFQTDGVDTFKILAAYHQYHAVNKAVEKAKLATAQGGDHKIGVVWHTQGSGKSLSMVFYAGKLIKVMNNPTLVVLTDRNDLDDQLYKTFSMSRDILRQTPSQADSRDSLRELLSVESGGIVFTTLQKFSPDEDTGEMPCLTNRTNVIVMADEAHRSQYGFSATMTKDNTKYGFAKYVRDALPNASFIGFTGTPVEASDKNTPAVFGDYIDVYDMSQAVEDGATVKIFYESRVIPLELPEGLSIDDDYEDITEDQETSVKEKLKSKWSRLEAIAGAQSRVEKMAKDIVHHYEERQQAMFGKSMIVVMSRRIAIDLYKEVVKLRPDWHSEDDDKGVIKIVITGSSSDPVEWQPFIGNKKRREFLARRMKDNDDPLKIVIVRDMWLTGFDVPAMNTMYVDKPMKGHNLMQAIARVNRVFKDKPGGLVVDYIGIADNLKEALRQYTDSDRKTAGIDTALAVDVMLEKYQLVLEMLHGHDYSGYKSEKSSFRIKAIVNTMDYVIGLGEDEKKRFLNTVTELAKAYALCATTPEAEELNDEIGFFKAVKASIVKTIGEGSKKKTASQMDAQINQLISKSVISEDVVDIYKELGLENPDISILSDQFLEDVRALPQKNLAVELLNRLLNGKVKNVQRSNLIQARKFSEMLQNSLNKYNKRTIETSKVIEELIELAKEMDAAYKRGEQTGMVREEVAFYDALASHQTAEQVLGDDTLKIIAYELTKSIKENMSIDWNLRESARAKMRITIKRLLKKYGYPPDLQKNAIEIVLEQAELMAESLNKA